MGKRTQTLDRGTLLRKPASRSRLVTVGVDAGVCGFYLMQLPGEGVGDVCKNVLYFQKQGHFEVTTNY